MQGTAVGSVRGLGEDREGARMLASHFPVPYSSRATVGPASTGGGGGRGAAHGQLTPRHPLEDSGLEVQDARVIPSQPHRPLRPRAASPSSLLRGFGEDMPSVGMS